MTIKYVDGTEVTGIKPENQELGLEILEEYKAEGFVEKLAELPSEAKAEIVWWLGRMEEYLHLDHPQPSEDATARELWEGQHSCIHCCFQLSTRPKPVQVACSEYDAMFDAPESENNGQFKLWHKKLAKMPIKDRKIVWGWVKARLGMQVPMGVLADGT